MWRSSFLASFIDSLCRVLLDSVTLQSHYNDDIMSAMASQITSLTIVCSTVYSSKKISKLHVTGLCGGNSAGTDDFPAQRASNAENVSIWWRHHAWRRHDIETPSVLLEHCEGNPPVTGGFPSQRVANAKAVRFLCCQIELQFNKQSSCRQFRMTRRSCDITTVKSHMCVIYRIVCMKIIKCRWQIISLWISKQ